MLIFKKPKIKFYRANFLLFVCCSFQNTSLSTALSHSGKIFLPKFLWSPWRNGQCASKGRKGSWVQIPVDLQGFSFSENKHRGPYFVGFQIMQFGYLQTMLDHPAKVPQLYPSLLLNCPLAHCENLYALFANIQNFLLSIKNK